MVEAATPTVATGSGSEAVAESCGGTVLLTDSGTQEGDYARNMKQIRGRA